MEDLFDEEDDDVSEKNCDDFNLTIKEGPQSKIEQPIKQVPYQSPTAGHSGIGLFVGCVFIIIGIVTSSWTMAIAGFCTIGISYVIFYFLHRKNGFNSNDNLLAEAKLNEMCQTMNSIIDECNIDLLDVVAVSDCRDYVKSFRKAIMEKIPPISDTIAWEDSEAKGIMFLGEFTAKRLYVHDTHLMGSILPLGITLIRINRKCLEKLYEIDVFSKEKYDEELLALNQIIAEIRTY